MNVSTIEVKMGISSGSSAVVFYGVVIYLPWNPSWNILWDRIANFDESSLFAKAARAVPSDDLKQEGSLPEQVVKYAKVEKSILVSKDDKESMTEKEMKDLDGDDYEAMQGMGEGSHAASALDKILGEGHGLKLKTYFGGDFTEGELDAVLVLEHTTGYAFAEGGEYNLGVKASGLDIRFIRNAEIDENVARALRAFGLEGKTEPGWKFVTTADRS